MTGRLHLPHPHIAERFAAAFASALPDPIVPDGHDWDDYHYPDASGYADIEWEHEHDGSGNR